MTAFPVFSAAGPRESRTGKLAGTSTAQATTIRFWLPRIIQASMVFLIQGRSFVKEYRRLCAFSWRLGTSSCSLRRHLFTFSPWTELRGTLNRRNQLMEDMFQRLFPEWLASICWSSHLRLILSAHYEDILDRELPEVFSFEEEGSQSNHPTYGYPAHVKTSTRQNGNMRRSVTNDTSVL